MIRTDRGLVIRRLGRGDIALAQHTFRLMADVFDEAVATLSDDYVATLLERHDFWALVALHDGVAIGGITAHALPMTRGESYELFIYDLAVHDAHQRRGVGRLLVDTLCRAAAAAGIRVAFVPADIEDDHAVAFYKAIGGDPAPVMIFTFEQQEHDRSAPS